jgi:hypothetical protein
MKTTLLDDYITTCIGNTRVMPVFKQMDITLKQTKPVAHMWREVEPLDAHLPNAEIIWPDAAMCLCTPTGVFKGDHRFCVDVGYGGDHFDPWFLKTRWDLQGTLLFQLDSKTFDVIPLARANRRNLVMGDMQLHFQLNDSGWTFERANTGPVNALFHDALLDLIDADAMPDVQANIEHLGNCMSLYLGSYWRYIQTRGTWDIHPAKAAKLKVRNGKVKKMYKPGTVGYKEFVPVTEIEATITEIEDGR